VAQLYDLTGDLTWVSGHKTTCERALDYIVKADSNGNHLVEMMTGSQSEKRGATGSISIWASLRKCIL